MKMLDQDNLITKDNNIVDNLIKTNGLYCLVARPKVGKSLLALQMANSIANNKQFLGFNTLYTPILYISTELTEKQLNERIKITDYNFNNNLFFVEKNIDHPLGLRDDLLLDLKEFAEQYNGRFVIIDMMCGINYGSYYDINDYKSMTEVVFSRYRDLIRKYNLTFLLIHHTNKSGNSLGSTAIEGCVDGIFYLKDDGFNNYAFISNSRDFESVELKLKLNNNLSFEISEEDNGELDFNLSLFLRYVIDKKEIKFTCADMVSILKLSITPTKFGMLLNKNIKLLKQEGITIIEQRTSQGRYYNATFVDPMKRETEIA